MPPCPPSEKLQPSTVLAALVIGVIDAARDIAIDKDKVDRAITNAGIDPTLLEDPDARVPLEQHIKLWSILATQRIGLDLGKALGMNGMGVVGYADAATVAPSVRRSLGCSA